MHHDGHCDICEKQVVFTAEQTWYRDHLFCSVCNSIPRERALMRVLKEYYPNFADLTIHESSPGNRGISVRLLQECPNYSSSHFFENVKPGDVDPVANSRCENLEQLTFADNSFDLIITQDVMEHIFNPQAAFQEIARVLKPGGAHIFTAPLIRKAKAAQVRASIDDQGNITHHFEPEYHGNPISDQGSLVTMHWGYDIGPFITKHTGMPTLLIQIDNLDVGIRAEYIEVIASFKPQA